MDESHQIAMTVPVMILMSQKRFSEMPNTFIQIFAVKLTWFIFLPDQRFRILHKTSFNTFTTSTLT